MDKKLHHIAKPYHLQKFLAVQLSLCGGYPLDLRELFRAVFKYVKAFVAKLFYYRPRGNRTYSLYDPARKVSLYERRLNGQRPYTGLSPKLPAELRVDAERAGKLELLTLLDISELADYGKRVAGIVQNNHRKSVIIIAVGDAVDDPGYFYLFNFLQLCRHLF